MNVLFVSWRHDSLVGGVQAGVHPLALELVRRGHEATVLASPTSRFVRSRLRRDSTRGYPTLRAANPPRAVPEALELTGAEVVVVNGYAAWSREWMRSVLDASGPVPAMLYLHDHGCADLAPHPRVRAVVAVSRFIAGAAEAAGVDACVINTPVDRESYRVPTTREVALFVNPVPEKGVDVAFGLARARPDIPFAFVRCWPVGWRARRALEAEARGLPNVELRPGVSDPARLYGDARVLLVPSRYPEPWGRVAPEAEMSGIPVIASDAGGLPEAVGGGGILVPPDAGPRSWTEALSLLWDDEVTYARYVERAERRARDPELTSASAGERLEQVLREVACA